MSEHNERMPEVGSFQEWLQASFTTWHWNWPYQERLYAYLDDLSLPPGREGRIDRLMISMPPRHCKSETVTVRYAAWRLLKDPALQIILGAYNQTFCERFSRKIRRIVEEQGLTLSKDRRAVEEWETEEGGGVRAVGVGAGVTGLGAQLILIDDPVKSREEAESTAYRDRLSGFPNAAHDDQVDATSQALLKLRQYDVIPEMADTPDEDEEERQWQRALKKYGGGSPHTNKPGTGDVRRR